MLVGLFPVTRASLRPLPWQTTVLAGALGLFQSMLLPEPARWWLWGALIAAGALLGLYGKYRSRFAINQGVTVGFLAWWWLAATCAGPAALVMELLGLPALAIPVFCLVIAYFLIVAALGMWRGERPWREAMTSGAWESRIEEFADRSSMRLAFPHAPLPAPPRGMAIWPALGVNLPIAAVAVWGEQGEVWLVVLVLALLLPIFGWMVLRFMADMAVYRNLRCYERERGVRFTSDQQAALAEVRSTFRLRRWLCRPEDRTAPERPRRRRGVARLLSSLL